MLTKPCARPGCTASAAGKYCSKRCCAIARLCAGWKPQASILRPEARLAACRKGALASAASKRRERAKATQAQLRQLLGSAACFHLMQSEYRMAVMALVGKAYRLGKADGYQRGWNSQHRPSRARQAAEQTGAAA